MSPEQQTLLQVAEMFLVSALVLMVLALITSLIVLSASRRVSRVPAKKLVKVSTVPDADAPDVDEFDVLEDIEDTTADEVSAEIMAMDSAVDAADAAELAELDDAIEPPAAKKKSTGLNMASFTTGLIVTSLVLVTVYLAMRWIVAGHGPFSNMHEFAVSFVWGILVAYLVTLWKFKMRMLSLVVLPVTGALLTYAIQVGTDVNTLVPALQDKLLLTLHVGFAVTSYGAACVSFGAAVLYLLYPKLKLKSPRDRFDEVGYKAAIVTFPLMTIMILLGALWANSAWGRYWGWDPKETAALLTWLLYAGFLHARVVRGWHGAKSAWLLILGFAAVMFAYFGNYFLTGLHSIYR